MAGVAEEFVQPWKDSSVGWSVVPKAPSLQVQTQVQVHAAISQSMGTWMDGWMEQHN